MPRDLLRPLKVIASSVEANFSIQREIKGCEVSIQIHAEDEDLPKTRAKVIACVVALGMEPADIPQLLPEEGEHDG